MVLFLYYHGHSWYFLICFYFKKKKIFLQTEIFEIGVLQGLAYFPVCVYFWPLSLDVSFSLFRYFYFIFKKIWAGTTHLHNANIRTSTKPPPPPLKKKKNHTESSFLAKYFRVISTIYKKKIEKTLFDPLNSFFLYWKWLLLRKEISYRLVTKNNLKISIFIS